MPKKKVLAGIGIAATVAVVCLLGSLGLVPAFAQAPPSTNGTQATVQSADEQDDVAEAAVKGPDTDSVEEQVGDQTELDEQDDVAEAAVKGPDTDAVEDQVGEQVED